MNMSAIEQLIEWVEITRQTNNSVDNEADALLVFLLQQKLCIENISSSFFNTGIVKSKSRHEDHEDQLDVLESMNTDSVDIILDGSVLNFEKHIKPTLSKFPITVKLTNKSFDSYAPFIVPFHLMSSSRYALQLIKNHDVVLKIELLDARLEELEANSVKESRNFMSQMDFLKAINLSKEKCVSDDRIDDSVILKLCRIGPWLSEESCVNLLSFFWGNDQQITSKMLNHNSLLSRLGGCRDTLAPARSVIDALSTYDNNQLFTINSIKSRDDDNIPVCSINKCGIGSPIYIPKEQLLASCQAITLTLATVDALPTNQEFLYEKLSERSKKTDRHSNKKTSTESQIDKDIHHRILKRFSPWLNETYRNDDILEKAIRDLQSNSDLHGELIEGLMVEPAFFSSIELDNVQNTINILPFNFDILADNKNIIDKKNQRNSYPNRVYKHWINLIRMKGQNNELVLKSGLEQRNLEYIINIIIKASYNVDLLNQLNKQLDCNATNKLANTFRAALVFNEFLTWLGYDKVPQSLRPESKLNPKKPLFSSPDNKKYNSRGPELDSHIHSNVLWLGDWLVALDSHAREVTENWIQSDSIQNLSVIFDKMNQ